MTSRTCSALFGAAFLITVSAQGRSAAPNEPAAVFAPGIAYDIARSRLVIFGGEAEGRRYSGDTWEFDGSRWSRVAAPGPSPRVWSALAYDPARRRLVLFGGADASGALADTWEFDGTAWRRLDAPGPAARFAHEMAFDARRGRVILFGGRGATALDDTWEWDGARWQRVDRSAAGPAARFTHALAYDGARGATTWRWRSMRGATVSCYTGAAGAAAPRRACRTRTRGSSMVDSGNAPRPRVPRSPGIIVSCTTTHAGASCCGRAFPVPATGRSSGNGTGALGRAGGAPQPPPRRSLRNDSAAPPAGAA